MEKSQNTMTNARVVVLAEEEGHDGDEDEARQRGGLGHVGHLG